MKATSWNFPFIGARIFLVFYALNLVPTFAATTNSPENTTRILTASSIRTLQVVADEELQPCDEDYKQQIAASLPITATPPIDMTIKKVVQRPEFIPSSAFTNEEMVAPYHDLENGNSTPTPTQELPKRIKLNPAIARHWTGAKVEPFWVNTTPDKNHPGTYSFSSEIENGPKGWLLHTGERSAWGHPEYRYWLDPS